MRIARVARYGFEGSEEERTPVGADRLPALTRERVSGIGVAEGTIHAW